MYIQISSITLLNASRIKDQRHLKLKASNRMKHHEVMKTTSEMQAEGLWRCSEPQPSMISCKTKFQRPSSSSSKQWASRWWCVGWCEMRDVFLLLIFCILCISRYCKFPVFSTFPQIYLGSHVFLIHMLFRWHAATKAPTGRNTCCSDGSTVSCEGKMSELSDTTWKSHSRLESLSQVLHQKNSLKQLAISWDWGLGAHWWQGRHSHQYCHVVQVAHGRNEQFHHWQQHGAEAVPSQKIRENKKTQMSKRMCTRRRVSKFSVPTGDLTDDRSFEVERPNTHSDELFKWSKPCGLLSTQRFNPGKVQKDPIRLA